MSTSRIYRSNYPRPHVPTNLSISQYLQLYNPDDTAADKVIFEDDWTGKTLTYSGLRAQSARGAFSLRQLLNLEEGGAGAFVDVVLLIHAVLWCGGTAILVNPLSTSYEVAHCLGISEPKILVADSSTWPTLCGTMSLSVGIVFPSHLPLPRIEIDSFQAIRLPNIFQTNNALPPMDLSERDSREHTACVCFSSGTSGKAKGVELSHYNLVATMAGIRPSDTTLWNETISQVFFAPLCHIYGLVSAALMGASIGYYTMLMRKYTLGGLLELSAKVNANTLRILPTIAVAITKDHGFDLAQLRSIKLIMCAGATLPPKIIEFFNHRFPGAPIFQGYGMTETNITTLRAEQAHMIGSVGKLFANLEARLVDDDMNDVKFGDEGEMLVRGPTVFRRYMKNQAATDEAFHNGWMKTGDILRSDENGFFYLTERKKELIKYKGNQVAPAELEAYLGGHPYVRECAVCALWDEDQGTEVPIAYVVLTDEGRAARENIEVTLADIQKHVDSKVSPYKKLRGGVVALDEIPKTGTGKVLRRLLPARLAKERSSKL
ncbi:acyl-CoA synthetases/AMP-acid ligases II [Mytilinidion resinicola]|uniref:Acyl-CoA synthetases/AMP-acid ligases II n=1 Tax=Mytilinidion resinicola TaxID=574789 RepID=A0A6A6Z2N5_9PEZI|nr:acyl-CoA synthetases/AMP-acid ligases II [Mytilinidion resinicola]KAF2814999.1 acyl-CoA synthetases/AMP-acid ligases II [Mytilinidion resinicola]